MGTCSCLRSIQLLERSVHSKSILAFILRSQPRYTSGGSRDMENHAILSLQCPKKQKKNLGHFRLSEWYAYRRLPTVNWALRWFWGVNQLSTTSSSRDMDFRQFWEFWPKNCFRPPFNLITNSILKIHTLRIPKQLLSRNL